MEQSEKNDERWSEKDKDNLMDGEFRPNSALEIQHD